MKKLFLLFIFIFGFSKSQTHRFLYEFNYKMDSLDATITKDIVYLDINSDESIYYTRNYFVNDSIFKASQNFIFDGKMYDILQKNLKTKEYTTYTFQGFDGFKLKDFATQNWKIKNETKILGELKVQKAETAWAGRNWLAWFAPEIPFQEGPYKFHGLPGLIVEISDSKDNFHISLIKSENLKETQIIEFYKTIKSDNRVVEIPYKKYQQMKLNYYHSPMKAARDGMIDYEKSPIITDYGTKISNAKELKEYEDAERKRIVKYNNPIELDKVIYYPK